jgi:hypothetical protein
MNCHVQSFCCGCFSLETGVKLIGIVHGICSFISFVWTIVLMNTLEEVEGKEEVYQLETLINGLWIPCDLVSITVSILLVIGAAKKSTTMMLPALAWIIFEMAAGTITFLMLSIATSTMDTFPVELTTLMMIIPLGTILNAYFFVTIKSLYSDLKGVSGSDIKHSRFL